MSDDSSVTSNTERSAAGSGSGNSRSVRRGFAAMDRDAQREIASAGGRAAHQSGNAHEFDSSEAREAGRKGGARVSQDREHMRQIGRRGGMASRGRNRGGSDEATA